MNKKTNVYIHNRINANVDEFILSIAENYNPDWNISPKMYVNLVRDRVYKQLKQCEKELTKDEC